MESEPQPTFKLKLSLLEGTGSLSLYGLGHIQITSHDTVISSRSHSAAMIFVTIPELLDGLRGLLQNPHWQRYEFSPAATSFSFTLAWRKKTPDEIKLFYQDKEIGTHKTREVIQSFRVETARFVKHYEARMMMSDDNSVKNALEDSLAAFEGFTFP